MDEKNVGGKAYNLDILTKRNVEELYLTASEEDKEYVIDSYLDAHEEYNIRTASPISKCGGINTFAAKGL